MSPYFEQCKLLGVEGISRVLYALYYRRTGIAENTVERAGRADDFDNPPLVQNQLIRQKHIIVEQKV